MSKFHLLPLWQLPDFDKREYWDLIQSLGKQVEVLDEELKCSNEQLEQALAEVARLQSKLSRPDKTSENSSIPPAQDQNRQLTTPIPRHAGRPRKRIGHQQSLPESDVIWHCEADACDNCGADLSEAMCRLVGCQRVIDLPPIHAQVIELRRYERQCACGHCQTDAYPAGYEEVHQHYGPQIHALISYFNGTHHVAHERLQKLMQEVFSVSISDGAIVNTLQRTRRHLKPLMAQILEGIRHACVVGSDETGLKLAGKRGWLWVVQTPDLSYFAAVDSRAGKALEDLLIDASNIEVWMSDLYSAQLSVNTQRYAICNAHQLRDLQYAINAGDTVFAPAMQHLLRCGLHLSKRRSQLTEQTYQQAVHTLKQTARWLIQLDVPHPDVCRLQKRFHKHFDAMWLFLDREDVPFDNNASERALRPATTHRKVIGSFRTDEGADAYAMYRSLEDTARKQKQPILSALHNVLRKPLPIQ